MYNPVAGLAGMANSYDNQSENTLLFPLREQSDTIHPSLFWTSIVLLFLIIHFPKDKILPLISELANAIRNSCIYDILHNWSPVILTALMNSPNDIYIAVVAPVKQFCFTVSIIILAHPNVLSIYCYKAIWSYADIKRRIYTTVYIFFSLFILMLPLGLRSQGVSYGWMSIAPFDANSGWQYRRLLMPAMAHILGLYGLWYYFFSLFLTFLLIYWIISWLDFKDIKLNFIGLLSLTTSIFISYGFQFPGYPDQLFYLFLVIASCVPLTRRGCVGIIVLCLSVHEFSIFVLLPLVLFFIPRQCLRNVIIVVFLYFFIFLMSFNFDIHGVVNSQIIVSHKSAIDYFLEQPALLLLGIFFSYKLLWLLLGLAFVRAYNAGDRRLALSSLAVLLCPLIMLPIAVDTSRLAGTGFMALLFSLYILKKYKSRNNLIWHGIFYGNLVIPPLYVGLNTGIILIPDCTKWPALW